MPVRWPSVDRDATASTEDVEEQFDLLVEANDHLLEQVVSRPVLHMSCSCIRKKFSRSFPSFKLRISQSV